MTLLAASIPGLIKIYTMKLRTINSMLCAACLLLITSCGDTGGSTDHGGGATDSTSASLQDRHGDANPSGAEVTTRDEDFVTDAVEDNAEEIAWLRMGAANGTDAELRTHAEHMLADHQKMDTDMRKFAMTKNISLDKVDTVGKVDVDDAKGKDWDEEWSEELVEMHEKTIRRFERAQDRVTDAELKTTITNTLPTLRAHLDMAKKLEERLDK
jgi:putative membrane protein